MAEKIQFPSNPVFKKKNPEHHIRPEVGKSPKNRKTGLLNSEKRRSSTVRPNSRFFTKSNISKIFPAGRLKESSGNTGFILIILNTKRS